MFDRARSLLSDALDRVRKKSGRPLRYVAAGAFNALIGVTFFPALLLISPFFHANYMIALVTSQVVCTTVAFLIYKMFVFRTRGNIVKEFGSFVTFYLLNYTANWILLPILVEVGGMSPIWAQSGFVVALAVSSYFWHSRISFQKRGGLQAGVE